MSQNIKQEMKEKQTPTQYNHTQKKKKTKQNSTTFDFREINIGL